MSSRHTPSRDQRPAETSTGAFFMVATILLGLLVGLAAMFAVLMWADAHKARDDARKAAKTSAAQSHSMPGMDMAGMTMPGMTTGSSTGAGALTSYAGAAPENADALAAAHKPFPADVPPAPPGPIANVNLALTDITVQIAPGVKYSAWAWAGGAPGPVIHVRQGQLVKITLTNNGAIPHSVDFHAARIAPDKAFGDVLPGK
jgi:FtsP/CotA-like multicopper oxidase with cupredoxin domain